MVFVSQEIHRHSCMFQEIMFHLGTCIFFVLTVPQVVALVDICNDHEGHSWPIYPAYGQFLGGSISYTMGDVGGKMMVCILYIST